MKKTLSLIMALVLILSLLVGCAGKQDTGNKAPDNTNTPSQTTQPANNDGGEDKEEN